MRELYRNIVGWLWGCCVVPLAALAQPPAVTIYKNDFTTGDTANWHTTIVDPEWQRRVRVGFTGNAAERVLGDFGDQRVTLRLGELPPHDSITITFDFITIRSWDGNSSLYGPDLLEFKVDDTLLFRSSFSNTSYRQSFPSGYPASHPARTGAIAFNSLGYIWRAPGLFIGPMDATYRITRTVLHTAPTVRFGFNVFLDDPGQDITNESWALDNVSVSITPQPPLPEPPQYPPQPAPKSPSSQPPSSQPPPGPGG